MFMYSELIRLCRDMNQIINSVGGDLPIIENNGNHLYLH